MAHALTGRVIKDRRTKNLTRRLRPGDMVLIHHSDLDTTAARALIDGGAVAVINAVPSISGRYPNRGPMLLLEAGVPLLDNVGQEAFDAAPDGRRASLTGDTLRFCDEDLHLCFQGQRLTLPQVSAQMEAARDNLSVELDSFARNTLDYLKNEKALLFDPLDIPCLKTSFRDRQALIVVRGEGYKDDLALLKEYLEEFRPVIIAVDGGADALLETHLKPDIILGDMDSVSDAALRCGAELVVHGYARGDERGAPGLERIRSLGLQATVFHAAGTSEDIAMLLADELGAQMLVAVGTHFSLEDFLDKGRKGMASTFLTRLRIGSKLVDARGIARLWRGRRLDLSAVALVVFAACTPIIATVLLAPAGQNWLDMLRLWLKLHIHFR